MKRAIRYGIVTEKSSRLQANNNQYIFAVDPKANKFQIAREVESLKKDIEVIDVKTLIVRGKVKRLGVTSGKRSNYKKAIVRLKAGQTLEVFEAV